MDTLSATAVAAPAIAKPSRRVNGWHLVGLLAIFLFAIFPFYWMVATSMKTQAEALSSPPIWLFTPRLDNYVQVLFHRDVLSSLANSLIVAVSTTALAVGLGTPAAYALARFEFKGKEDLWFWFITNRMLSPIVVALPIFLMARTLGLIDTRLVLILVYLTFNLPIVVWICTDQFRGVPKDLDEAARLSGASRFTIFWRIALPLAMPGVAVSAIFSFIFSWNELLYALVLTRNVARTAPVTATSFMSGYDLPWGEIMATGTLIVFPVIIFALMVSKHLVQGLTMGAVK
ncbi:carbohydrate ABC transporter permease [Pseudomonas sp. CCI3.2]|uniref:carbohydrate ABC transporter permease n=1 Tax=unclassified Pseudomonas TaxID=196821 RepID=UPI002AC91FBE|nr:MULTISPECIES: carbohydrate ABC transporter permease [unclassified Pseudomonas]MEB0077311.1 carbohydrate ABC transporter permease [Pseudomonas sp. MH10out]MEB0104108.1 carbohydrate ABC transporter permease [Pseudomonas sp. CCI3.2]MEB0129225.1 carbohydrate ABC transporter permease [Pseudomonas sp. CCI2.4]MEB0157522.1 carbohydrate ABC transporter permease [Pseudomonas sp. AH2 (2023)]MEB0165519.1 carbohydrate ABC transporter permease [Pseudomonas sp. CCC4.4]